MANANVIEFTDANFDSETAASSVPVLVDFWAPWCGPCRMIAPLIDEIANEKAGQAKVGKVNVDDNPGLASKFGIQAIPTLLILKNGEVVKRYQGLTSKSELLGNL